MMPDVATKVAVHILVEFEVGVLKGLLFLTEEDIQSIIKKCDLKAGSQGFLRGAVKAMKVSPLPLVCNYIKPIAGGALFLHDSPGLGASPDRLPWH